MSSYATLKSAIQAVIKQNGNNEITGDLLQQTLLAMIESLGAGYQFAGVATPSTNPGTPDQRMFYIGGPGTYVNFGDQIVVGVGCIVVFRYATSWTAQIIDFGSSLLGTGGPYNDADTLTSPGFYWRNVPSGGYAATCIMVTTSGGQIWQFKLQSFLETFSFAIRHSLDGGTTWTEWKNVDSVGFNGAIDGNPALDALVTRGVYRFTDDSTGYVQRVVIVSVGSGYTEQIQLTGSGALRYRRTNDGGTTWTPWVDKLSYLYGYPTNESFDLLSIGGAICGYSISAGLAFQYAGTTRLYPVFGGKTITITAGQQNTPAIFFKMLPPAQPAALSAAVPYLATGETSRRIITAGTTQQIIVPTDAVFIMVGNYTSGGISNGPASMAIESENGSTLKDAYRFLCSAISEMGKDVQKNGLAIKTGETINVLNPNATPINDTYNRAAGENHYVIDRQTGIAYVVYNEGVNSYYETTGLLKLCVFPLAQPWRAEWFELAKTEDGNVGTPINPNIVLLESGKVRCFITGLNYAYLAYKDFDIATKQFFTLQRVQYNGADLSGQTLKNIIDAAGYSGTGQYVRSSGQMENCSDGTYKYQLFCDAESEYLHPVILRSADNFANVEVMGVFPFETRYDATMAYYNGTFHILYRRGSATGLGPDDGVYLTTTQDFVTYAPAVRVGTMDMRPDIFAKTDGVYLVVGDKRNQGEGFYRTNMHILKGSGAAVSGYTKVINVTDDRGTVNPCVYLWGNNYHFVYGTSPLRLDAENGWSGQWQGKECTSYLRIRENA